MINQTNAQRETPVAWAIDQAGAKVRQLGTELGGRIIEIFAVCSKAWAAANVYEELSRLSNAELERRGMGRVDLHRHVLEAMAKHS